ncbi:MAG TPA: O-methyltransferase [Puia sp.]|nr:O-methyltransferase [Puia sp.]
MDLIEPRAEAYAEKYSTATGPLLQEIAAYTSANHAEAHMLSGPVQGKFLEIISRLTRPRRILEIGTFMGYSALCLAAGLADGGKLHTIELRDEDADVAEQNFRRANQNERIILHRGNALAIIPTLDEVWDLVFIDADKPGYVDYYRQVMPRLKSGGLILADNVLFHGQVLQGAVEGKSAKGIQAFNDMVAADATVEKVMLTVRDGLFLILKK